MAARRQVSFTGLPVTASASAGAVNQVRKILIFKKFKIFLKLLQKVPFFQTFPLMLHFAMDKLQYS